MKNPYDLIVFDWDGTLMDSERKIVNCFLASACDCGVPEPAREAVRNIIGLGLSEAVSVLFPEALPTQRAQLVDRYRHHFLEADRTDMVLFPGVAEGLQRLVGKGYLLAVATGKSRRGLERALEGTAIQHLFTYTRCADEAFSKPHPKMLEDILGYTGVVPKRALMIGDTVYDLQMAQNASVPGLAVTYGVHPRTALLQLAPLACLDSFDEVCQWLH